MSNMEKIGAGRYKQVFRDTARPERVIALHRGSLLPQESKSILYFNRIVRLLMPGNTISVHAAGNSKEGRAFHESTYVPHDSAHRVMQETKMGKREHGDPEAARAEKELEDLKKTEQFMSLQKRAKECGFSFDPSGVNYIQQPDGSVIYVDFGPAFIARRSPYDGSTPDGHFDLNFDPRKLHAAIETLSGTEKIQAETAFQRIMELAMEVRELKNKPV